MCSVPNSLIDYEFVVMAIYVSGAGHALPSDMGMPSF